MPLSFRMRRRCAGLAVLVLVIVQSAPADAKSFGPPVPLSLNGHAATVSVAIDDAGNALATWADAGMYYSDRPAGGSWSAPQTVFVGGAFPVMRMTGAGAATIVSYSSGSGIWSVDRAPGGSWTSPTLIVSAPDIVGSVIQNVSPVQFLSNANGDQAVVFQQLVSGNVVITAVRRPAGGGWGAQDQVASSADYGHLTLTTSALGANGDLVVTFETFSVVCSRYCHNVDFAVHASREPSGTTTWSDSGALTPTSTPYNTRTVIDASGHAALLIQNGFSSTIQATTQAKAGAAWSPLAVAFAGPGNDGAQMWTAEAGAKGRANLAFVYLGPAGAFADVLDGSATKNKWPTVNTLSTTDSPGANDNMAFDANLKGGAVAAWADTDGTIRAALRVKATAAWGAAQTITAGSACNVGGVVCTGVVAAAVNKSGSAVVAYIRFDPTVTIATLYVATE